MSSNSILIATHALAFLFGGMLVALAWHANTRDTRQPKQEPPAGFDSDPMMDQDFGDNIVGFRGVEFIPNFGPRANAPRADKTLPNSGYPLSDEEVEAWLADCLAPPYQTHEIGPCRVPKGTFPERAEPRYDERCGCEPVPEDCKAFGINSPKTDTGD